MDMLDPAKWKNTPYAKEFARAEELIWNAIAPRAAHQQRVENLVQIAGHLGKTNVSEARRSARAKIHSLFYRGGFIKAVQVVSEMGDINKVGREYFEKMPSVFLEKFKETFWNHTKKWRSTGTLPIIIAGHPKIAKAYLQWQWLFGSTVTASTSSQQQESDNSTDGSEERGRGRVCIQRGRGSGCGRESPPEDEVTTTIIIW
jgi:hypothetical protein